MSTNDIYDALLALGAGLRWGDAQQFEETSRRLKMWDKAPDLALYQVEPEDEERSADGQLDRETLHANWVIYHRAGKDQSATPARVTTDILDAVKALFKLEPMGTKQTLGGLVYRTFVNGKITKAEGDLDGQTMIVVPITILVP